VGDETILGAEGDQFAPGGAVAGFGNEFPVADADAGIPADERGLPPLTASEQLAVEEAAQRQADDFPAEPETRRPGRDAEI
jgi:signal peptidase II